MKHLSILSALLISSIILIFSLQNVQSQQINQRMMEQMGQLFTMAYPAGIQYPMTIPIDIKVVLHNKTDHSMRMCAPQGCFQASITIPDPETQSGDSWGRRIDLGDIKYNVEFEGMIDGRQQTITVLSNRGRQFHSPVPMQAWPIQHRSFDTMRQAESHTISTESPVPPTPKQPLGPFQELTIDYSLPYTKETGYTSKVYTAEANETISYKFSSREESQNNSVVYVVRKPMKMRQAEWEKETFNSFVDIESSTIYFSRVNAFHHGLFVVYRLVFAPNGTLVQRSRHDFEMDVHQLSDRSGECQADSDCASGHCLGHRCACTRELPVYVLTDSRPADKKHIDCFAAKRLEEKCEVDMECREILGPDGECYDGKCRCQKLTMPVKVGRDEHYCVRAANLNSPCLLSKQCSMVGQNRYCNNKYRCDCLPGHLLAGTTCYYPYANSASLISHGLSLLLMMLFLIIM